MLLVVVGRLLSPLAVPVFDGVGAPDEPYRYVAPPAGSKPTAPPTSASGTSPVVAGVTSFGMSVATAEQGPQFSLYVPPKSFKSPGSRVVVRAVPQAPSDQPSGGKIDGNVYSVSVVDSAGAVTLTPAAALATLYLRATSAKQPGPVVEHRASPSDSWTALKTSRGGNDIYVATFPGAGQYALAFLTTSSGKSSSPLPYILIGGLLLVVVVIVVVRFRAAG